MTTIETVKNRLQYWNLHKPPNGYSQNTYSRGADGYNYRNDCSGYVSMLLGLHDNPYTGAMVDTRYTSRIDKNSLRFGDCLIALAGNGWHSGHVVMFDHWEPGGRFYGHEFGWGDAPAHRTIIYPYNDPGTQTQDTRTFRAYRFRILTGTVKPTDTRPAAGTVTYGPWSTGNVGHRVMKRGSRGTDVRELQRVLNEWYPTLEPLETDGYYGPLTVDRVKYLQRRANIDVDGKAGPVTLGVLGF